MCGFIFVKNDDNTAKINPVKFSNIFFQVWDLRKNDIMFKMSGHTDSPTGFRLSPDGSFVLSNAMDNTGNFFENSIHKIYTANSEILKEFHKISILKTQNFYFDHQIT